MKIPVGYTFAVALQNIEVINIDLSVVCVLSIVVMPCLVLVSTAADIKCGLGTLNMSVNTVESDVEITQQFIEIVKFHSNVKQLSEQTFVKHLRDSTIQIDIFLSFFPDVG